MSDPNDIELVERAIEPFTMTTDRPTMIIVHSHIGYGAPHKQDTSAAHGEPLGAEEVRLTKEFFGFDPTSRSLFRRRARALRCRHGRAGRQVEQGVGCDVRPLQGAIS